METNIISSLYFAPLTIIFLSDLKYRRIPNWVIYPTAIGAVTLAHFTGVPLLSSLAAGIFLFLLCALMSWASKGGFGMGDAKLIGLMGLILGVQNVTLALVIGLILAGVTAIAMAKKIGKNGRIPLGCPLTVATGIVLLFSQNIWGWYHAL